MVVFLKKGGVLSVSLTDFIFILVSLESYNCTCLFDTVALHLDVD